MLTWITKSWNIIQAHLFLCFCICCHWFWENFKTLVFWRSLRIRDEVSVAHLVLQCSPSNSKPWEIEASSLGFAVPICCLSGLASGGESLSPKNGFTWSLHGVSFQKLKVWIVVSQIFRPEKPWKKPCLFLVFWEHRCIRDVFGPGRPKHEPKAQQSWRKNERKNTWAAWDSRTTFGSRDQVEDHPGTHWGSQRFVKVFTIEVFGPLFLCSFLPFACMPTEADIKEKIVVAALEAVLHIDSRITELHDACGSVRYVNLAVAWNEQFKETCDLKTSSSQEEIPILRQWSCNCCTGLGHRHHQCCLLNKTLSF